MSYTDDGVAISEKEKLYDEVLSPKIVALAKECQDAGFSMLVVCEWEPGKYGSTRALEKVVLLC